MKNILIVSVLAASLAGCGSYSEGSRTGTVQKISKKGIMMKTWEGELVTDGLRAGTGNMNVWNFSVDNDDEEVVIKKLQEAQEKGVHATLYYEEQLFTVPTFGGTLTDYHVKRVVLNNQ